MWKAKLSRRQALPHLLSFLAPMSCFAAADEARRLALARRMIWWKTPGDALVDRDRLLAQVMKLGTWDDIVEARSFWPKAAFREALQHAPPGLFDARSWSYWHQMLDQTPVPPLPRRVLPPF